MKAIRKHFANWKASPRKWEPSYLWAGLLVVLQPTFSRVPRVKIRHDLMTPPIEAEYVKILLDPEFKSSLAAIKGHTCLDFARLANLWNLARLAGPGVFVEVGSFQGGTALHICNAIAHRAAPFYCFDPFEKGGFEKMHDEDKAFEPNDFMHTNFESVVELLSSQPNAKVVQGFFPAAAENLHLEEIAFCHLDVDIYEATRESLEYLAPRLAPRGLIVLDDFDHLSTPGVNRAVADFLVAHPTFVLIPMFPVQAVLVPKSFW